MNSVLQCLSNTKPLLLFCFEPGVLDDLNSSTTSVMKGALMERKHRHACPRSVPSGKKTLLFSFRVCQFDTKNVGTQRQSIHCQPIAVQKHHWTIRTTFRGLCVSEGTYERDASF